MVTTHLSDEAFRRRVGLAAQRIADRMLKGGATGAPKPTITADARRRLRERLAAPDAETSPTSTAAASAPVPSPGGVPTLADRMRERFSQQGQEQTPAPKADRSLADAMRARLGISNENTGEVTKWD